MKTYRKTSIKNLALRMNDAGATNVALAEAAGVCPQTVQRARKGNPIRIGEAALIEQALSTRAFQRDPRGPRGRIWGVTECS